MLVRPVHPIRLLVADHPYSLCTVRRERSARSQRQYFGLFSNHPYYYSTRYLPGTCSKPELPLALTAALLSLPGHLEDRRPMFPGLAPLAGHDPRVAFVGGVFKVDKHFRTAAVLLSHYCHITLYSMPRRTSRNFRP
jgi:hypothetical protein